MICYLEGGSPKRLCLIGKDGCDKGRDSEEDCAHRLSISGGPVKRAGTGSSAIGISIAQNAEYEYGQLGLINAMSRGEPALMIEVMVTR